MQRQLAWRERAGAGALDYGVRPYALNAGSRRAVTGVFIDQCDNIEDQRLRRPVPNLYERQWTGTKKANFVSSARYTEDSCTQSIPCDSWQSQVLQTASAVAIGYAERWC